MSDSLHSYVFKSMHYRAVALGKAVVQTQNYTEAMARRIQTIIRHFYIQNIHIFYKINENNTETIEHE